MSQPRSTIRHKLVAAMMLTSTTVLLLTGAALVVSDIVSFRASLVRTLDTRAHILAANLTAALAFQNPDDARQILSALSTDPTMSAAVLYDQRGALFATSRDTASPPVVPARPMASGYRFESSALVLSLPVVQERRWLGTLHLRSNLQALDARVRLDILVVLVAIVGSIGVAFALSSWLQRGIGGPIGAVAGAARSISEDRVYSIQGDVVTGRELRLLTQAFNDMLGEIQQRDGALRASEARVRAILESALDGIVTMDHEGRIVEFNPAAERLFGHTRAQAMGSSLADLLIPPTLHEGYRRGLTHYLTTGHTQMLDRRMELTAITAKGGKRPVEVAITRIQQEGAPIFTGFIRDITDRKRAEQEIRQLNADLEKRVAVRTAELEALNRELEAFSYSVSHDLRAPVRHIDGFADMLRRHSLESLDEKGRRYLAQIADSARSMGQLIDDLLVFSRMGRLELRAVRVDLDALVREVREAHATETAGRKIDWRVAALPEVEGDPAMLRVVFTNLIANAIKYTSQRARAEIEIGAEQKDGETIIFVRDNGVGFDMAYVHKLFGVFQRLHSADEFEGTGIGLANVRRIIERHGGKVRAEGAA